MTPIGNFIFRNFLKVEGGRTPTKIIIKHTKQIIIHTFKG